MAPGAIRESKISGNIIGGVIGAAIGFVASGGNPYGAMYGWTIGSVAGGLLFPTQVEGPRLQDLKVQSSEYGRPIPIVYGHAGIAGNVIWAMDLIEVEGDSGGGKGGAEQTVFSYFANFAVAICEGPVELGRIWAGPEKRLIWDGTLLEGTGSITFYNGTDTQQPDPLIESDVGVGNAPAYRGTAYVVFEMFPLQKDGNRIPFLTFEVGATVSVCPVPATTIDGVAVYDPPILKLAEVEVDDAIITAHRVWQDEATGLVYFSYTLYLENDWFLGRIVDGVFDHDDSISLGEATVAPFAWDGQGTAAFHRGAYDSARIVDLASWAISGVGPSAIGKVVSPIFGIAYVSIDLQDIAYDHLEGNYKYLSYGNTVDQTDYLSGDYFLFFWGTDTAWYAADPVSTPRFATTGSYSICWDTTGERFGGYVLPMYPTGRGAASFNSAWASYATTVVQWDAYVPASRMLVAVDGASSAVYVGTYGYIPGVNMHFAGTPVGGNYDGPGGGVAVVGDLVAVHNYGTIYLFDPADRVGTDWPARECTLSPLAQGYADGEQPPASAFAKIFSLPNDPGYVGMWTQAVGGHFFKVPVGEGTVDQTSVPLSEVVADLCDRAGLSAGQVDVTSLADDIVDGYVIGNTTPVKDAILALAPAYFFDGAEWGGKINFIKRGGDSIVTIPDSDLGATESGSQGAEPLLTTRMMDDELPRIVTVKYLQEATKYEVATRVAKRLVGESQNREHPLDLPMVLSDTKAQEVAEVNLHAPWISRLTYSFTLPRKYSYLTPTDIVVVGGYTMRLVKVTKTADGRLKCEAAQDDTLVYTPTVVVTETVPDEQEVAVVGATTLVLM